MFIKMRSMLNIFLILMVVGLFTACSDSSFTPPSGDGSGGDTGGGDGSGGDGGDTGGDGGDTGGDGGDVVIGEIFKPFSNDLYFGRTKLTDANELKAYDLTLKTMLDNYTKLVGDQGATYPVENSIKIDLKGNNIKGIKNKEQLNKIVSFIESDEPRLFHISNTTPISISNVLEWEINKPAFLKDSDGNITEFYVRIDDEYSDYKQYSTDMNKMEIRVQTILKSMGDISTDTKPQIVRNIHEKHHEQVTIGFTGGVPSSDIRGAFLNPNSQGHYVVNVDGHSHTLLYLLQRLNTKAIYITGTYQIYNQETSKQEKHLHSWNKVDVGDGKWYNMDPASDDDLKVDLPTTGAPGPGGSGDKNFFLKSDADYQERYIGVNKNETDQSIGYLLHGVSMPISPANSLTPADYQ